MIRPAQAEDHDELVQHIALFRITMSRFTGKAEAADLVGAEIELDSYNSPDYPGFRGRI